MSRPVWNGAISFGLIFIPVSLHSAESPDELDLSMLDKRDFAPIGFKRYNKHSGKDVGWSDIVKGYEYQKDEFVVLSDADFRQANVKATQTIDLMAFVDMQEIPPLLFEKPYYLVPGKRGEKVYALLREALRKSGKAAVAQIVIRVKQHLAVLVAEDDAIVLNTLRYPEEVRDTKDLALPAAGMAKAGVNDKELKMALALIEGMSEEWDPAQYRDSYRHDLMALIETKIRKKQTHTLTPPAKDEEEAPRSAEVVDLVDLLKRSLPTGKRAAGAKTRSKAAAEETEDEEAPARRRSTRASSVKESASTRTAKRAAPTRARTAAHPDTKTRTAGAKTSTETGRRRKAA